jgi:uncharacterized membrane protein
MDTSGMLLSMGTLRIVLLVVGVVILVVALILKKRQQ